MIIIFIHKMIYLTKPKVRANIKNNFTSVRVIQVWNNWRKR